MAGEIGQTNGPMRGKGGIGCAFVHHAACDQVIYQMDLGVFEGTQKSWRRNTPCAQKGHAKGFAFAGGWVQAVQRHMARSQRVGIKAGNRAQRGEGHHGSLAGCREGSGANVKTGLTTP